MNLLLIDKPSPNTIQIAVELKRKGISAQITRIDSNATDFLKQHTFCKQNQMATNEPLWDAIIANTTTTDVSVEEILEFLRIDCTLEIPLILIVTPEKELEAISQIRFGVTDYLFGNNLQKLGAILERELRKRENFKRRIATAAALKGSEKIYRSLWETSKDLLLVLDRYGNIQHSNQSSKALFGYECFELIGKHISILQPPGTSADIPSLSDAITNTTSNFIETRALHKSGKILDVETSQTSTTQNQAIILRIRDVTELKYIRAEQIASQKERRIAEEVQKKLYPSESPKFSGFDIAGRCFPAEGAAGDYYGFSLNKLSLSIGIGDVSGHGIGPALLMSEVRAYLKAMIHQNPQHLDKVLTFTNQLIGNDMGPRYITVFLLQLFNHPKMFRYANAGHIPGYLIKASGVIPLGRTGIVIGRRSQKPYEQSDLIPLYTGDTILLLTDGVEELSSKDDPEQSFGSERILKIVQNNLHKTSMEIIETIYEAGKNFAGVKKLPDDFTAVVIKTLE